MRKYDSVGIAVPDVLLPREGIDLTKWAVVACDQYTSQPEYWQKAKELAGEAPSTLNLIYPEVFLGEDRAEERIQSIRRKMKAYLQEDIFTPSESMVYVEREAAGKVRKGMVLCIDLEQYDYRKGSESLIRATEGTILERIPPRVKIREGASLELPHIMILIDDPEDRVIGPVSARKDSLEVAYDFDLMMGSGNLKGFKVTDRAIEEGVVQALENLGDRVAFKEKYGLAEDRPVLLFAMGDGNHSLATAKAIWEKTRESAPDSPARYALVELVNLHDPSLVFEPIHRVVFETTDGRDLLREMEAYYKGLFRNTPAASIDEMKSIVDAQAPEIHRIGVIGPEALGIIEVSSPDSNLPVGSLQTFLDEFLKSNGAREVDYIHGTEPVVELGRQAGNLGFYLPAMKKHDLFKTVILDGALPRKTFSMGEADEKRFYMECRKIS